MEGRAIKAKYSGTQGLLYDHGSDRDMVRLKGGKPKNHTSENVRKMRQQAKERKEAELERSSLDQSKKSFKLSQFKDVPGRAKTEGEMKGSGIEEKHNYVKAGTGRNCAGSHVLSNEQVEHVPKVKSKPRVPRKEETLATHTAAGQHIQSQNFLKKNFTKAVKNDVMNRQSTNAKCDTLPARGHARGQVPTYIKNRKQALAEERKIAIESYDPHCPRGMAAMPDEERVGALEILFQNKDELTKQLGKLSFARSLGIDKRRNDIYDKLNEIDGAITVFSKPKVYVSAA